MDFLHNFFWLLVLIGVMILIHELGHYWAALMFDVRVDAFSFGFGPRLFGFKRGETDFRFSAILFGGYVKMAGEQPGDEAAADPRSFMAKPRWQRLIIAFAGPFMNIVLAVVILTGLYMVHYPKVSNDPDPTIGYVTPDSAASKAGVREGDRILQIDDHVDPTWEDVRLKEIANPNHPIQTWVERDGQRIHLVVTPNADPKEGLGVAGWEEQTALEVASLLPGMDAEKAGLKVGDVLLAIDGKKIRSVTTLHDVINAAGSKPVAITYKRGAAQGTVTVTPLKSKVKDEERWMLGVALAAPVVFVKLPFPQALNESLRRNAKNATLVYQFLEGIVARRMSAKSLSGPIGIAQASGEAAREGLATFLELMVMVSLNLAIFNLLPIPILDGGVILLLLVEMLMRRDLSLQVKETVFKVGFVFLMAVVAFVIYNDITKIIS
ncbi:MAG TPA: RIP metalloprotease RseP [Bryobacteraceae bacterium]|jgi:regulator of sigma E protease|nr:RIP metalloprotease RseP [Bryobacteraceae bacterium]